MNYTWNKFRNVIQRKVGKFSYIVFPRAQQSGFCHYHVLINKFVPRKFLEKKRLDQGYGFIKINRNKDAIYYLNNDFFNNTPAHIRWEGVSYSDISVFNSSIPYASDNISCDPEFIVPGNYHLLPTSCCIDAGASISAAPEDLDGDPRSGIRDIGADEYTGLVVPVNNPILVLLIPIIVGSMCLSAGKICRRNSVLRIQNSECKVSKIL